ncbi:MAG TPA: hypothetical protein VIK68_05665 [Sphingomicrobium sp.]
MADNSDQLAELGQKVLDAVLASYKPDENASLALAVHPGQPLADDIVQNGVTNPLRVSEWLGDQYDFPLSLKLSDATPVTASLGALAAKSAYVTMVRFAQPSMPTDDPAYPRINAMIADARQDLGDNPDTLPFGCDPDDFAEADSTVWQVFDQTIATSTTTSVASAPSDSPPNRIQINPDLWKMRILSTDVVQRLPSAAATTEQRRTLNADIVAVPHSDALMRVRDLRIARLGPQPDPAQPALMMAMPQMAVEGVAAAPAPPPPPGPAKIGLFAHGAALRSMAFRPNLVDVVKTAPPPVQPTTSQPIHPIQLNAALVDRLSMMQVHDLAQAPEVSQVTTTDSDLHVHFEYCLVTITRKLAGTPWWHTDFVAEDDWYVPGMKRGDAVPEAAQEGFAYCLPQALLLVRNVAFTGTWSAEAKESLANQVSYLGPFLMRAQTDLQSSASATEQVSVLGAGIQVIGELCTILPTLPPRDSPGG